MKKKTLLFLAAFALAFGSLLGINTNSTKVADAAAPGFRNSLDHINKGKVVDATKDYVSAGGTSCLKITDLRYGGQSDGTFTITSGWMAAENGIKGYVYSIDGGAWQNASCTITNRPDLAGAGIPYANHHDTAGISNLTINNIPEGSNFVIAFVDLSTDEKVEFYNFCGYTSITYAKNAPNAGWITFMLSNQDYSDKGAKQLATSKKMYDNFKVYTKTAEYTGSQYLTDGVILNYKDVVTEGIAYSLTGDFNTSTYGDVQKIVISKGYKFPTYAYMYDTAASYYQYFTVKEDTTLYRFGDHYALEKDMKLNPYVGFGGGDGNNNKLNGSNRETILEFKNKHFIINNLSANSLSCVTGEGMLLDGKTFASVGTKISYAHGNSYLYFVCADSLIKEGSILEIKIGTKFYNSILPGLTFKMVSNKWVLMKNVEDDNIDKPMTSISTKNLSKLDTISWTTADSPWPAQSLALENNGSVHVSFYINLTAFPTSNDKLFVGLRAPKDWYGIRFYIGPTNFQVYLFPDGANAKNLGENPHGLSLNTEYKLDFYALDYGTDQVNCLICVNDVAAYSRIFDKSVFNNTTTGVNTLGSRAYLLLNGSAGSMGAGTIRNNPHYSVFKEFGLTRLAKKDVTSSVLKDAFYAKQLDKENGTLVAKEDNSSHLDAEMDTIKYVTAKKGEGTVEAIKVERYTAWGATEYGDANNYSFSEFRIKANGKVKSVSFSYLLTDASEEVCKLAPEGDKSYNSKTNLEIKTSSAMGGKYINASRAFDTKAGFLMTGDSAWHDANVVIGGTDLQHISFKVFHLQGMLLISNVNIVYENAETANTTYVSLKVTKDTSTGAITQKFIRFGLVLDDATYTALKGQGATFGMYLSYSDGTHTYYKDIALTGDYAPVKNSDNEWVSSIVLPISEAQKDIVYSAKAYMVIQGNKQYFVERSYSFTTLVAAYQQPEVYNKLSAGDKAIIDQLGGK